MSFGLPSLCSSQPMWYVPDSPCTLPPQYFSTCSLTYLTLFLMFAKHAASFKQTTEPKQKKTHSSFSWPDPNNIYNTSPIWTCEICLPATRKKKQTQSILSGKQWSRWDAALHMSLHLMHLLPLLSIQILDHSLTLLVIQWVAAKIFLTSWVCFLTPRSRFTYEVESCFW